MLFYTVLEMKQLILLLTVAALVGHSQAQGNRKCAANGEYCLTHSECCSGSCLSFSYKCVPVPPSASVGTAFVPAPIETDNRFGGPDDGGASITQKTCAKNGEYCLTHAECCSGSCLSFSYKCVPTQPPASGTSGVPQQPAQPQPPPTNSGTVGTTVDLGNRVGEGDQSTVPTTAGTTAPPRKCAAVGEYCLTAADCCSRSCLSFSYKCVQNYNLGTQQLTPSGIPVQQPVINNIDTTNRFGTSDRKCLTNGHYCFHSQECCSGACFNSFCATQINLGVPESELTRPSVANGPFVQVNSLDELITRFGGGGTPAASRDSTASASVKRANIGARSGAEKHCAAVGEGCSRQEDCCSMRCHSYRRKCVT